MLTMDEYDTLNELQKAVEILNSSFLADREENDHIAQLYSEIVRFSS